jgi:hypothetical protein
MKFNQEDYNKWYNLYVNERLSLREIAEQTGASKGSINKKLKELGVIRSSSESHRDRNQEDPELWYDLYVNKRLSIDQIVEQVNADGNFVSKGTVYTTLKELGVIRTYSESRKGKIPWNKGLVGQQVPWNKGMKGSYPYPSPFKGHVSSTKGIARSPETIAKISYAIRIKDYNGFSMYKAKKNDLDNLYLITIKDKSGELYKIGRTFYTPAHRFGSNLIKIHKIVTAKHYQIVAIEAAVLANFSKYSCVGITISGKTECFSKELPLDLVSDFIDKAISSQANSTGLEGSETTGEVESS